MASFRRTKIVCTIGPASESEEMLAALMEAGMDVARLNLSHGTLDQHRQRLERLRRLAGGRTPPVAVMVDIQGPKIRLGQLPEPLAVERGMVVVLRAGYQTEDPRRFIPVAYPTLAEDLRAGQVVYLDDGLVELAVEQVRPPDVVCRVVTPGTVRSRTGVALPGVENRLPALTDTDREHLRFAVQHNADLVAQGCQGAGQPEAAPGGRARPRQSLHFGRHPKDAIAFTRRRGPRHAPITRRE